MKNIFLYLTMLSGMIAGVTTPVCHADEADDSNVPAVKAAVKDIEFLTDDKPMANAKYYVYLHSASWCGPCKALMPQVVKDYKKMKKKKIEVILIGHDNTPEAAKAYLEHYEAGFPCILHSNPAVNTLPGYSPAGSIPQATIVDAQGNVLYSGHGKGVLDWKKICKPVKKNKKK